MAEIQHEEKQPLIANSTDNTSIGINYDSINSTNNEANDSITNNEIDNEEGCTPPQASFNLVNLVGK